MIVCEHNENENELNTIYKSTILILRENRLFQLSIFLKIGKIFLLNTCFLKIFVV